MRCFVDVCIIMAWVMKMCFNDEFPARKRNRLKNYDYSSPGAYFVTICTKDRRNLFWDKKQPDFVGEDIILPSDAVRLSTYGEIAETAVKAIPEHYKDVELLQYVIMPNHIHMILFIPYDNGRMISSPTSIVTVVGQMKRSVSKRIGESVWQRSFHDHVIRNKNDYDEIVKYICENPIRWQYDCLYREE